jgi:hypothetical protein
MIMSSREGSNGTFRVTAFLLRAHTGHRPYSPLQSTILLVASTEEVTFHLTKHHD